MKSIPPFLALLFVSSSAFGGQDPLHPHFTEVKGDHEFSGRMIVRPKQIADLEQGGYSARVSLQRKLHSASLVSSVAIQYRPQLDEYIVKVPRGYTEDRYAGELLASGDFQYVEPDWKVFLLSTPNDPMYAQQWHLPKIRADLGWNLFSGNDSVIVALTDTGVRLDHVDLSAALVPGYNSVTDTPQANGGDVNDTHGHGTHTAGIAGAIGNNAIGVTGVSQHVKIMPIKVVTGSSGSSSMSALTGGAVWAADHGARVISTSFSGFDSSSTVQTTGDYIKHTKNGLYCWAAGNDNRNLTSGDWADVTVVGASTETDARASFSAFGAAIDVFAPGTNIVSTYDTSASAYATLSGTSMATPCVAGLGALIIMANPSLTGQQVEDVLYQTCDNIGASATFGWGRVNLNSALLNVYNNYTFAPVTATVTAGINTGGGVAQLTGFDSQVLTASSLSASALTIPVVQVQYDTTTTISQVGVMTLTYAGNVTGFAREDVEFFDWTTSTWVLVDSRPAPRAATAISVQPPAPNRFKNSAGLIRFRATYTQTLAQSSTTPVNVSVDQVSIKTAP